MDRTDRTTYLHSEAIPASKQLGCQTRQRVEKGRDLNDSSQRGEERRDTPANSSKGKVPCTPCSRTVVCNLEEIRVVRVVRGDRDYNSPPGNCRVRDRLERIV
ncbi:MAG: hypothetical protein DRN15_11560 [Thermoprotei archaeon]|nr:MAG: hypothetical protein DRN15_11560 [Thermoprotei archaeon]